MKETPLCSTLSRCPPRCKCLRTLSGGECRVAFKSSHNPALLHGKDFRMWFLADVISTGETADLLSPVRPMTCPCIYALESVVDGDLYMLEVVCREFIEEKASWLAPSQECTYALFHGKCDI